MMGENRANVQTICTLLSIITCSRSLQVFGLHRTQSIYTQHTRKARHGQPSQPPIPSHQQPTASELLPRMNCSREDTGAHNQATLTIKRVALCVSDELCGHIFLNIEQERQKFSRLIFNHNFVWNDFICLALRISAAMALRFFVVYDNF